MEVIIDATSTQDELRYHGIGVYTTQLINSLLRSYPDTIFNLLLFDGESNLDTKVFDNCHVNSLGKYRSNNFLNKYWYITQYLPAIKKLAKKDAVYFCPYFWRYFPYNILPTIVTIHDMALPVFDIYSVKSPIHNIIRKYQYWDALNGIRGCKKIVCDSQYACSEIMSFYPDIPKEKYAVVELGVSVDKVEKDLSKYLPSDWKQRGYFIYSGGTLSKNKNSVGVIKGYKIFVDLCKEKSLKTPYLVIAGKAFTNDGQESVDLKQLIDALGLRDNIIFTGYYEKEETYALLKNSQGFIHLSTYEGFGLAVAEAMSCGIPVIAHKGSSYTEVVGDAGLLVNGLNEREVGEAILKVYSDRKYANSLAEKGITKSRNYTWECCAKSMHALFRSISR